MTEESNPTGPVLSPGSRADTAVEVGSDFRIPIAILGIATAAVALAVTATFAIPQLIVVVPLSVITAVSMLAWSGLRHH